MPAALKAQEHIVITDLRLRHTLWLGRVYGVLEAMTLGSDNRSFDLSSQLLESPQYHTMPATHKAQKDIVDTDVYFFRPYGFRILGDQEHGSSSM
ncbi:hypothetical protein Ccrd_005656 [Cynara cardunculus var. scolymus]|uniref:Uncharacterized protein n=1 Tax=Cynara cardunculus var. scolymus TaxID=59895 RepID=A0A118JVC5_CYNCS|nr:hypothetical protein Ccrd_005656 [Cynara cardunculus var. scolymus]